jgi:hypothetical protein
MALAWQQIKERVPNVYVVYRFVGITPSSSSARALMRSVYAQVQGREVREDRERRGRGEAREAGESERRDTDRFSCALLTHSISDCRNAVLKDEPDEDEKPKEEGRGGK